jgi:hypothetical protein
MVAPAEDGPKPPFSQNESDRRKMRKEEQNDLDHSRNLIGSLATRSGHLVHPGRSPSRAPGHSGRGDSD